MGVRIQFIRRHAAKALLAGMPLFAGCASTWDTVTSQRFKDDPFHVMLHSDDPAKVLKSSDEADLRAKAMLEIKEPKKAGGSEDEQFQVLQILATAATSDKHPQCRMNAIAALGRFEDPRTAHILATAYQLAGEEMPAEEPIAANDGVITAARRTRSRLKAPSSFTADNIVAIQSSAIEALGRKQSPESLALLCQVATRPAKAEPKKDPLDPLSPATMGHDATDLRIAAVRALGNFKGETAAAHALYQVMTTERGPALKNRAHQSLMNVTGQSYAPDAPEWRAYLQIADSQPNHLKAPATN